jgi:diguanylate cyclase (GGDEF)-like protein
VDGFGPFVEAFGSEAGYECLARVASAIVVAHRAGDLLAFNGGAKFGAILPETDLTGALILAERMRARVAGLGIRQAPTSADRFVSISVGVATVIPALGSSCAALEAAASHALLEAKAQGHNRVVPASVAPLSVGAAAQETPLPLR